jgi:hypothetical protein
MPNAKILTNALIAVGTGTASADRDISNRCKKITWSEEFDEHDVTVMGSTTRINAIGLGKANIEVELMQSYTTSDGGENIDSLTDTFRDLSATGGKFLVRVRQNNSARLPTNPEYSMLCVMSKRTIFDGQIGDVLINPLTFLSAGDVTRVVTSS